MAGVSGLWRSVHGAGEWSTSIIATMLATERVERIRVTARKGDRITILGIIFCAAAHRGRQQTFRVWTDPIPSRYSTADEAVEVISENKALGRSQTLDGVYTYDSKDAPSIQRVAMRSRRFNRRSAGGGFINKEFASFTAFVNDARPDRITLALRDGPGAARSPRRWRLPVRAGWKGGSG